MKILISVLISFTLFFNTLIGYADDGTDIAIYLIDNNLFDEFLSNPSTDILQEFSHKKAICAINKTYNSDIDITYVKNGSEDHYSVKSGVGRVGNPSIVIDFELIEAFGTIANIEKILSDNEINCNVNDYILFAPDSSNLSDVPLTLFVETTVGNYFITRKDMISYSDEKGYETFVETKVYSQEDYCNKFRIKNGKIEFDGRVISDNATFRNTVVHMPFRIVAESIGCDVSWDDSRKAAIFSKDNESFFLRTDNYYAVVKAEDVDVKRSFPPGGTMPYVQIVDGSIMIDDVVMNEVLTFIGASMKIDYDNFTIKITQ